MNKSRIEKRITLRELYKLTDISISRLSELEQHRAEPSSMEVDKIALVLGNKIKFANAETSENNSQKFKKMMSAISEIINQNEAATEFASSCKLGKTLLDGRGWYLCNDGGNLYLHNDGIISNGIMGDAAFWSTKEEATKFYNNWLEKYNNENKHTEKCIIKACIADIDRAEFENITGFLKNFKPYIDLKAVLGIL